MQKYSNCTKWTINKVIIYHMNKTSHNELGKEAEQAYWDSFRPFFFFTVMVATPKGLPLSVNLTFGIFYEMLDAWSLLGSKTFCLLHNELSHQKKKRFCTDKTGT